jgi:hypothetical protein
LPDWRDARASIQPHQFQPTKSGLAKALTGDLPIDSHRH